MVRNVECCLLSEVTNTVLELVKVQQLPERVSSTRESPDQLTGTLQSINGCSVQSRGWVSKNSRKQWVGKLQLSDLMKQYQSGLRGCVLSSEDLCYVVTDPGLSINLSCCLEFIPCLSIKQTHNEGRTV